MQIIRLDYLTYLVSKNKKVRVWHKKFRHGNNAKIIKALKMFTKM